MFNCTHIAYYVDYFISDITGFRRHSPVECTIDDRRRNCEGECKYFMERSLIKRFKNWIKSK